MDGANRAGARARALPRHQGAANPHPHRVFAPAYRHVRRHVRSGIHGIDAFDPSKNIGTGQPPAGWQFSGIFSDTATIIFDHQFLAVIATIIILAVTVQALRHEAPAPVRDAALAAGGLVILQFVLGVTALVSKMLDIGVIHQMNAVLLLATLLLMLHRLRGATT